MIELSKSEKRELRSLAGEAYRTELAQQVEKLEAEFGSWRRGDISVFDLDDRIHEYHSGPRKQLYNFYQMQNQPLLSSSQIFDLAPLVQLNPSNANVF